MVTKQVAPGMFQQYTQQVCDQCPNVKLEREQEALSVDVEPGMPDGHEIIFFEQGEPLIDGEPGDLRFRIRTARGGPFERDGDDLRLNFTVSLVDALVGFERSFVHLDGREVKLAAAGVTRPGEVRKVEGEGMPLYNRAGAKGDLWVTYSIEFPASLTEEQKGAVRAALAGTTTTPGGGGGATKKEGAEGEL